MTSVDFVMNQKIPEDDDVSYAISVKNKRYQAGFRYFDSGRDTVAFMNALLDKLSDFFT